MGKLSMSSLPGEQFHYANGLLTAEASALGGAFRLQRIFDDAADVGIRVRGKTGVEVDFALTRGGEPSEENDGERQFWDFIPATRSDERKANGVKRVRIFND